ncbi:MAG: DUF4062 domain-containing protein [Bacteroidota bacterium]|nr:DUF4062 domain-containing protein [Bacteroidota bacterium]
MAEKRNHIKVFVASSVYNFESDLNRIYELLDNLGYDVYMSHKGSFPLNSKLSNLKNCTNGVEDCDVFVGFIRPDYGSGVLKKGGKSITHSEFETAYKCNIPRFVLADYRVPFTRNLFRNNKVIKNKTNKKLKFEDISFEENKVMDTRCVNMYNEAIKDKEKPASIRTGNWVQSYIGINDIVLHLESQFKYPERITKLINNSN